MSAKLESIASPRPDRNEPMLATAQARFAEVVGRAIAEEWWRQHPQQCALLHKSLPKPETH